VLYVTSAHLYYLNYFCSATEMMPCLHNYITVDTPAFLANPKNLELIYNMCKKVITFECVPSVILNCVPHFVVWFGIAEKILYSPKKATYMCSCTTQGICYL